MKNFPDLDPQNKYVAKIVRLKRTATGGAVVGSVFGIAILAGLAFLTYKKVRNQMISQYESLYQIFQHQAGELVIPSGLLSRGQAADERGLIEDDPNEPQDEPIVAQKPTNSKSSKFCYHTMFCMFCQKTDRIL